MSERKPNPVLQLPVYLTENGKMHFLFLPHFFFDLQRVGRRIPPNFWKVLNVVWRYVVAPKKISNGFAYDWTATTTVRQLSQDYGINEGAVKDAMHWFAVSGLFTVIPGKKHFKDKKGTPTRWLYRKESTKRDWTCFIIGLSKALTEAKKESLEIRKANCDVTVSGHIMTNDLVTEKANTVVQFQLDLILAINAERGKARLPSIGAAFIQKAIEDGHATRHSEGRFSWSQTIASAKNRLSVKVEN